MHLNQLEIILPLDNEEVTLNVKLNHNIMSKTFKQIYHENGQEQVIQPGIEVSIFSNSNITI